LVNIDQVNGYLGSTSKSQLGPHVGHSVSLTGRTHTSGWV